MTTTHKRYDRDDDKGAYLPTPEEIKQKAAEIRQSWTDRETCQRLGFQDDKPDRVELPLLKTLHHRKKLS